MDVPHVRELAEAIGALDRQITSLQGKVNSFSGRHLVEEYNKITAAAQGASAAGGSVGSSGTVSLGGSRANSRTPAPTTQFGGPNNPMARQGGSAGIGAAVSTYQAGGSFGQAAQSGIRAAGAGGGGGGGFGTGPGGGMGAVGGGGGSILGGMGTAYSAAGGGSAGLVAAGISGVMGGISKGLDLLAAITASGVQYVNNRIEGPTGNRNAMMSLSQALAPISTTTGIDMRDLVKGLAQKTPVQGSMSDIAASILAGNAVGAQVKGTPGRNGYFQALREMQTLTPGIGAGQMAGALSNYMGNTASQQMGAFFGGGAFTMMGAGGRYKSLGEWAQGITEFFKQQRPGSDRGKDFTKADLMAQNFPGSNVNAWFQMMGVPQDMVDYWWQYVLTKAQAGTGDGPFDLQSAVRTQRGNDLGAQRLETITQASRRDFLMGTQMYGAYGVKEAADKRFNVAMQRADLDVANLATNTNVGMIMSMMPTAVSDLLMPIITKMAGTKIGAAGSMVGMLKNLLTPDDKGLFGDLPGPIGDLSPVGDYGPFGGTSTGHLTPGLAKKIAAMQRVNPRVKITSGYRDMFLQRRLGKRGVGRVSGKPSEHTKGWAADLGPTSELAWINANAHRFGIQMAGNHGEPWHAQEAGTMHVGHVGDIHSDAPIGDFLGSAMKLVGVLPNPLFGGLSPNQAFGLAGKGADIFESGVHTLLGGGVDILSSLVKKFIGGNGGTDDKINSAIALFIQTMLSPVMGLANFFDENSFSERDVNGIIGNPTSISYNMPKWKGFEPAGNPASGPDIFGDLVAHPTLPNISVPHAMRIPAQMPVSHAPTIQVQVSVPVVIQSSGNETIDARRTAAVLSPHIEDATRRAVVAAGGR